MNSAWSKILVLLMVIAAVAGVIAYKQYSRPHDGPEWQVHQPAVESGKKLPEVLYFSRFT